MDFTQPVIQDRIVDQAIAISKCGLYDGIYFDFWSEEWRVLGGWDGTRSYFVHSLGAELQVRLNILRRIRSQTRPNFLIMGNVNDGIIPRTAPYVNGGFMAVGPPEGRSMIKLEHPLTWFETNLREPRINALEGWTVPSEPPDSPANLRWMSAFITLNLTHSNGYVLFTDSHNHHHYWYDFWDADLGRPVGAGHLVAGGGARCRNGLVNTEHALPDFDGEMYLRVKPKNSADVNGDGVVNILDLTLVAQGFGTDSLKGDVNGDGFVNILDLVFVANQF